MEQETLFTASKWDILKMLSTGPKSPLQLSKLSNTSVANISQQLRLLEMAGLVQSKRISNRDKGQPRQLYSLVGNHSFLIASASDFVDKKLLKLSDYNKIILKIWFIDNAEVHYFLEKAFWTVEALMPSILAIFVDKRTIASDPISLIIVSDNSALKKDLKKITVKNMSGIQKTVAFAIKSNQEFSKLTSSEISSIYSIYDPNNLAKADKKQTKGA